MIGILKSNLLISPLILFVLTILLRLKGFFAPTEYLMTGHEGPVYQLLHPLFNLDWIETCISIVLIFLQAFLINRLVLMHSLMRPPNYVSAFCYIILSSLAIGFLGIHPVLIANTFIILAIGELYKIYKHAKSAIHIFNAGFLFAIAALTYFPIAVFYVACSIIITIMRSYNIIERIQLLIGFLLPFYLLAVYLYLKGQLDSFLSEYIKITFQFPSMEQISQNDRITLIFYGSILLMSILYYRQFIIKKGIQIEKKIDALYWLPIFALISYFFLQGNNINHLLLLAFPLSIFMAMFLLSFRLNIIPEFIALVSLALIPVMHFILA